MAFPSGENVVQGAQTYTYKHAKELYKCIFHIFFIITLPNHAFSKDGAVNYFRIRAPYI